MAHLRRLHEAGVGEVAVNLHHLGDQIERHLREQAADSPKLAFSRSRGSWAPPGRCATRPSSSPADDFLVVNSDAAIDADFAGLLARHRESGRAATLLVTENRDPKQYTPLQAEGDRITAFGVDGPGSAPLHGRLRPGSAAPSRIPAGETSLVADLWQPILDEAREEIGFVLHHGPHADLGRPGDFLRASLEALARGGPFPEGGGDFDGRRRVLARAAPDGFDASDSVLGRAAIAPGAVIRRSTVWDGVDDRPGLEPDGLPRGSRPSSRRSPL